MPHGSGTLVYFTNDPLGRYNYTGGWRRGQRAGEGATAFRDGRVYTGQYDKDRENGRGRIRLDMWALLYPVVPVSSLLLEKKYPCCD